MKDYIKESMRIGFMIDRLVFDCTNKYGFNYQPHYVKLPMGIYHDLCPHPDVVVYKNKTMEYHGLILCPTLKITSEEEIEVF